jgi:hypothetical protein
MGIKGSCHCGATQFTVAKRPETVTRCTCSCSFCSKRGALWAYQDHKDEFVLTTPRDRVSTYQWAVILSNTITARFAAAADGPARRFGIGRRNGQYPARSRCR